MFYARIDYVSRRPAFYARADYMRGKPVRTDYISGKLVLYAKDYVWGQPTSPTM